MSGRKNSGTTKASAPPDTIARTVKKQGNLDKKSSGLARRWQSRFFVLYEGGALVYREQMDGEVRAWYDLRGGTTPLSRVSDLAWRFWCPWRRSWLCCCARGGANAGHARLRDDNGQ